MVTQYLPSGDTPTAEQAKLALASDPLSSYAYAIYGMTCMLAGRRAEGIEISRRAVELDPDSYLARASCSLFCMQLGNLKSQSRLGSRH